jgi:WD40 repeat protein
VVQGGSICCSWIQRWSTQGSHIQSNRYIYIASHLLVSGLDHQEGASHHPDRGYAPRLCLLDHTGLHLLWLEKWKNISSRCSIAELTDQVVSNIISSIHQWQQYSFSTFSAHTNEVCGLKWSPDEQYLTSGGSDYLCHVWERTQVSTQNAVSSCIYNYLLNTIFRCHYTDSMTIQRR